MYNECYIINHNNALNVFNVMVPENLGLSCMSYRPLTAGVSAGSSLALALKLLDFDQRSLVDLYRSTDTARFDFLSFRLGLLCGICLYVAIEWVVTLRWAFIQWVSRGTGPPTPPKRKELYKLL